jgi:hypothetical protein
LKQLAKIRELRQASLIIADKLSASGWSLGLRLNHVARFIINAKDSAVLSDAAAAEIKTEREPPRARAPMFNQF